MKERPILMTAESVKAILDGRKTMTRRVVKDPRRGSRERDAMLSSASGKPSIADMMAESKMDLKPNFTCPYGQVGDRLWVRETFCESTSIIDRVLYKAEGVIIAPSWKWKPSIFMPRWASRITLEITELRVERLQEITESDALAEGCSSLRCEEENMTEPATIEFEELWNSLNAKRGYGWNFNPWVWVVSFSKIDK